MATNCLFTKTRIELSVTSAVTPICSHLLKVTTPGAEYCVALRLTPKKKLVGGISGSYLSLHRSSQQLRVTQLLMPLFRIEEYK
jgi:hypothetical protein